MAQRDKEKAKRSPARLSDSATQTGDAMQRLEARAKSLEAELEAARQRIAELESSRAQVANRIDWVIDSLTNMIDKPA